MTSVPAAKAEVEASWQQRFRVERILWSALAEERPDRGLVAANRSGRYPLYAWQVPTGELRQLTNRPEGVLLGFIDSLGRHVYYLDDRDGNEIGHMVRVPFGGGEPVLHDPLALDSGLPERRVRQSSLNQSSQNSSRAVTAVSGKSENTPSMPSS